MTDDERIKELYEAHKRHKRREDFKGNLIAAVVIIIIGGLLIFVYHRGTTGVNGGPDPTGCSSAEADSGGGQGC